MKKLVSTFDSDSWYKHSCSTGCGCKRTGRKVAVGGICAERDEALLFCELQRKDDVGKVSFRHEYQYR